MGGGNRILLRVRRVIITTYDRHNLGLSRGDPTDGVTVVGVRAMRLRVLALLLQLSMDRKDGDLSGHRRNHLYHIPPQGK